MTIDTCKYCRKTKKLSQSHIIPEYFYGPIYDEKHRIIRVYEDIDNEKFVQKGERDYLLCETCEGIFNDSFEKPYFKMMGGRLNNPMYFDEITIHNVNQSVFKLFHLSVFWRMYHAKAIMWENIKNVEIIDSITAAVLNKDHTLSSDFKIWGTIVTDIFGIQEHGLITKPCIMPVNSASICYCSWGGFEWYYKISKNSDQMIDNVTDIPDGGIMKFMVLPLMKTVSYTGLIKRFMKPRMIQ